LNKEEAFKKVEELRREIKLLQMQLGSYDGIMKTIANYQAMRKDGKLTESEEKYLDDLREKVKTIIPDNVLNDKIGALRKEAEALIKQVQNAPEERECGATKSIMWIIPEADYPIKTFAKGFTIRGRAYWLEWSDDGIPLRATGTFVDNELECLRQINLTFTKIDEEKYHKVTKIEQPIKRTTVDEEAKGFLQGLTPDQAMQYLTCPFCGVQTTRGYLRQLRVCPNCVKSEEEIYKKLSENKIKKR